MQTHNTHTSIQHDKIRVEKKEFTLACWGTAASCLQWHRPKATRATSVAGTVTNKQIATKAVNLYTHYNCCWNVPQITSTPTARKNCQKC